MILLCLAFADTNCEATHGQRRGTNHPPRRTAHQPDQGRVPVISLTKAASRYPGHRGATRIHTATLTRWILKGVKGADGQRVKLEAIRMGSRWLTSEAELVRFADALYPAGDSQTEVPARTPAARKKASEAVGSLLDQYGA